MRTTDMADELFSGAAQPMPAGVRLATARHGGVTVTRVEIAREGLSRPRGRYVTLEMPSVSVLDERDAAVIEVCARELRALLPPEGPVLVLGVGNRRITVTIPNRSGHPQTMAQVNGSTLTRVLNARTTGGQLTGESITGSWQFAPVVFDTADVIYNGVKAGDLTHDVTAFRAACEHLLARGAEVLILGCTELPIAFVDYGFDEVTIDPTQILAEAALRAVGMKVKER